MSEFDNIYQEYMNILEEGKLKNIGLGALAALSMLGSDVKADDVKKEPTKVVKNQVDIGEFLKKAKNFIKANEGERDYLYDDKHPNKKWKLGDKVDGNLTIGVGHLVAPDEVETYVKGINDKQIQNLFNQDALKHLRRAIKLFPKYWSYPDGVKIALLDGVFRGEYKDTQKTVQYINNDEWDKVPEEYIDREDYQNAKANGLAGVVTRMDRNRAIFKAYANKLKGK